MQTYIKKPDTAYLSFYDGFAPVIYTWKSAAAPLLINLYWVYVTEVEAEKAHRSLVKLEPPQSWS